MKPDAPKTVTFRIVIPSSPDRGREFGDPPLVIRHYGQTFGPVTSSVDAEERAALAPAALPAYIRSAWGRQQRWSSRTLNRRAG
jgi:hypothetical protein